MAYELCLGDEPLPRVIDRVVAAACAAVPALDEAACRSLVELIFRSRVRQTEACGRFPECRPARGLWSATPRRADGAERPAGWDDLDPHALPAMFGAAAAAHADVATESRAHLERALAAAFQAVVAPLLRENPRCGHADVCGGEPTFPLRGR